MQLGDMKDCAFIEFEPVFLVCIPPLIGVHSELEGALGNVASAYQLQHIVSCSGVRHFEFKPQSDLVNG